MSWRPAFRSSKFRHIYGKAATKHHGYCGVPITTSVHDNHHCSVNPCFIAVVTECSGGGAFLVLSVHHTGRVDPQHPRVCGHSATVLDVKWNPFDDHCIASCSEDCTVKLWDIPANGVHQNITVPRKVLQCHTRRVSLLEWHPTARDILLSSAYDYKVMVWDVSLSDSVLRTPVAVISLHPELVLSMSFNTDGSALATTCLDKRVRIINPRTGHLLQVSSIKQHKANKVVYVGDNMLLSTGISPWNQRQMVLWDTEDLSEPLLEEELDGAAGVLFPFYDPDTHLIYLAGKGDGNIRYYDISCVKPYVQFLDEYRSVHPQKGLGVMPKRGLDVSSCEIFRFYRLVTIKDLVEPLSIIVPRRCPEIFQEDIFPMTAGNEAAMTAHQWLSGFNRGPVLTSLKPGTRVANPYPAMPPRSGLTSVDIQCLTAGPTEQAFLQEELAYQNAKYPKELADLSCWQEDETQAPGWAYIPHCCEPSECPPSKAESELLQVFYRQQEEISELREQLHHSEVRITQLERDIKNTRNNMREAF
ncbi:hypothetical protein DPEC_G00105890 [Dallia pectoralis]|uniref:Uncharacterized protein n=1 Tax=Dallia pectoralis TaxID=75939 RepID=A0ACC2GY04_DALPE|nr:hypothetical protein DPEC_G00105890 [Dallia pectoralis]